MADRVLGSDVRFTEDFAITPTGDIDVVSGFNNIAQAIRNRLRTAKSSLPEDGDYGTDILEIVSDPDLPEFRALASHMISSDIRQDPRIVQIESISVSKAASDQVQFSIGVDTLNGESTVEGAV